MEKLSQLEVKELISKARNILSMRAYQRLVNDNNMRRYWLNKELTAWKDLNDYAVNVKALSKEQYNAIVDYIINNTEEEIKFQSALDNLADAGQALNKTLSE